VAADSPSTTAVLTTLLRHGSMSRSNLAERIGRTAPSITKAVQQLTADGFVAETSLEQASPRVGRPPREVMLVSDRELVVGLNLTGTSVVATVVDLSGAILAESATDCRSHDPADVLASAADLVEQLASGLPRPEAVRTIGVALSGDIDRRQGVARSSAFLGWAGVAVAEPLQRLTGRRVVVDNDVHALTVAESWNGAGLDVDALALITVGDGIGCSLIIEGRIIRGAHDVAGELGHIAVAATGPEANLCHCGRSGCLESVAGTAALLDRLRAAGVPVESLDDLATAADPITATVLDEVGAALGRGIATVISLFGPDLVIISPTHPESFARMESSLRAAIDRHAFGASAEATIMIRPTTARDWARGAAVAAIEARFGTGF
jgi:predicted NBD/HSP70 family sugar kinase